jgi:hypothetical protein
MKYQLTIELELDNNPLNWKIQSLESDILAKSREASRKAYSEVLGVYEKKLLKWKGGNWCPKDRLPKNLATVFGEMAYERYRVWDFIEKRSRYPLDEALGIGKRETVTKDFKKIVINQAVLRSYGQSTSEVFNQTGVKQSKMNTWHLVQKESKARQKKKELPMKWKRLALPKAPENPDLDPCPALGIDLDGTYCRSWKKKKRTKDHAVRVAVLYRHKVKVGKSRWLLKDKLVVASGPGEKLEAFLNRVTHTAVRHYGLHENTIVVVHGDGDPWIKNYALHYFPSALYRLDPWHVKKKIREATGLRELPETWIKAIYGKPDELIFEMKSFQLNFPEDTDDYVKLKELISYLLNNKKGMLPSQVSQSTKERHPRLFLRGSGTIERNIGWTVCDRFKLARMSWSQKGLENLLYLRENHLNNYQKPKFEPIPAYTKPLSAYL